MVVKLNVRILERWGDVFCPSLEDCFDDDPVDGELLFETMKLTEIWGKTVREVVQGNCFSFYSEEIEMLIFFPYITEMGARFFYPLYMIESLVSDQKDSHAIHNFFLSLVDTDYYKILLEDKNSEDLLVAYLAEVLGNWASYDDFYIHQKVKNQMIKMLDAGRSGDWRSPES